LPVNDSVYGSKGRDAGLVGVARFRFEEPVAQVDGVLQIGEHDPLLDQQVAETVDPDRQAELEPKLLEMLAAVQRGARFGLPCAEAPAAAVRKSEVLDEMVEHHGTSERVGQRGDEETVVAAANDARQRATRISPETVGDQPFAVDDRLGRVGFVAFPTDAGNLSHRRPHDFKSRAKASRPTANAPALTIRAAAVTAA
jgi:hypothetical protein